MIIIQPATTGLIVLGASKFEYHSDQNRNAFRVSYDGIIEYFGSTGLFYISDEKICDVFDLEAEKNGILSKITEFLEKNKFKDLFVYICSHGFMDHDNRLRIYTAKSNPGLSFNPGPDLLQVNFIEFDEIMKLIEINQECRTYCIVDCCYSGVIHKKGCENKIQDIDTDVFPKSATTILTANNQDKIGEVVAGDGFESIKSTMFTHALLDCLKNGKKEHEKDGFSFKDLQCFINKKIGDEIINELNKESGSDCPTVSIDQKPACMSECSDREHPQSQDTTALSRARIFPNKRSKYRQAIDAARSIQANAHTILLQSKYIEDLENQLNNLKFDMEVRVLQFESENSEHLKISGLNGEINDLKIDVRDLQSENRDLRSENQILKNRAVSVHEGTLARIREREDLKAINNTSDRAIRKYKSDNKKLTKKLKNIERTGIVFGVLSIIVFFAYLLYFESVYGEIIHYIGSRK